VVSGGIQEISIRYSGRINEWKTELVRNAAIQGVLNESIAEQTNVVNAAAIAQESGIRVSESKEPDNSNAKAIDFISLGLKTTAGEHHVRGAVLRGNLLRLLGVDNIGIEVPLEGNLIYIRNRDVPGVVGKVGSLLGQHGVNIANFALGRIGPDADAMAVVQVDAPAPEAVLQKLRELPEIQEVRAIQL
ncbi:MAG TPA: ACT domain-containing protein, partial [Candidatus Angelobacter sp.]|nr:ACT domain-containing protein [Candidatus Angelobacter sp.]